MDKKALSLPILISLVVGNMIGTGIYILPASLAQYGSISLLSWIYTSIGAMFLALTLASLNKRYPKTGGPYVYCKEAYGRMVGFIVAYAYWISNLVSIAGLAVSSVGYLGFLLPQLNANMPAYDRNVVLIVELSVVWFFMLINIIGIHTAGVVQLILTILKVAPLLIVILVGISSVHLNNILPFTAGGLPPLSAFGSAAALTFWAFIGLETATIPAENTQGASDIHKATVYGTLITALIYIASTFVLMGMIPLADLKQSQFPFAHAGTLLFGAWAALGIAICAVVSGLGSLNACTLIQGQIVFAAARDGLFPHLFAKLSKHDVPIAGQLLSTSIVSLLLILTISPSLLKQFDHIALLASLLTLITYFITTLAELKFLIINRLPLYNIFICKSFIITLLAAGYAIWMISNFEINILIYALIILVFSIPIYFFVLKKV